MSKLKSKRSEYKDVWKSFLKRLINSIEYFKNLQITTTEEILYSLKQELVETNQVIAKPGDSLEQIRFISSGTLQLIIKFDDGKEIVLDHLRQGCSFGAYSILEEEPTPIMFKIKAKTPCTLQILDFETLDKIRKSSPDLDQQLVTYESYIQEFGLPICDFSIPYKKSYKQKFKNCVRRAITFNEYKHKKKSKLSKLIVELKKQREEWELKNERKKKREESKNELAELIAKEIKNYIPDSDESMMYIMEIFNYMNKKMEVFTNMLIEQNEQFGFDLDDDSKLDTIGIDSIDDINMSRHEEEKSEAERINESFQNEFGLKNVQDTARSKAKKQLEEYMVRKERRQSLLNNNNEGLNDFIGASETGRASLNQENGFNTDLTQHDRASAYSNVMDHQVHSGPGNKFI